MTASSAPDSVQGMTKLMMHQRLVNTAMASDLESFIKDIYGHDVEIQAMEESSNDANLSFFATNTLIRPHDEQIFEEWKKTGKFIPFGTAMLLNFLVRDHHIAAGYYSIIIGY